MKTRKFALCLAAVFLVMIYINIQRSHTFTLSDDEGTIKTEQIQTLWGTVKMCIRDSPIKYADIHSSYWQKYLSGFGRLSK